jgi:hypothetical protein
MTTKTDRNGADAAYRAVERTAKTIRWLERLLSVAIVALAVWGVL